MHLILFIFAALIAVITHLKIKRMWVKLLVGSLCGFFGSIILGFVVGIILDLIGSQLSKDVALHVFKNSLNVSIATIFFLMMILIVLKVKRV